MIDSQVFGLPGNPVSSFACFHLVALPALRKMMGWANPMLRRIQVHLAPLPLPHPSSVFHRSGAALIKPLGLILLLFSLKVRLSQTLKLDPERPEYHRVTLQWSRSEGLGRKQGHLSSITSVCLRLVFIEAERPAILRPAILCFRRCPSPSLSDGNPDVFAWWAMSTGNQISSRLLSAR